MQINDSNLVNKTELNHKRHIFDNENNDQNDSKESIKQIKMKQNQISEENKNKNKISFRPYV